MMKNILIACDGSCLKNPGGAIGWAWARDDGAWLSNGYKTGTNQRAELLGLISILTAHPTGNLTIQMDSQFVINVATKWANGWERKGWKKADGKEVLNLDLVKPLQQLLKTHQGTLNFQWVKGHLTNNQHPLNTIADLRAGEASNRIKQGKNGYLDSKGRTELPAETQLLRNLKLI